jgi:hypothetical protein
LAFLRLRIPLCRRCQVAEVFEILNPFLNFGEELHRSAFRRFQSTDCHAPFRVGLHYPIVLETEASGAVSAYVPGLPVYAAADTHAKAERAIRDVLAAYLNAHPGARTQARVRVARFSNREKIHVVGVAALLGSGRSARKHARRG